jgi:hypothetical protein
VIISQTEMREAGIEAGGGLVEEQDLRIVHHAARYFEAASHAARERGSEGVGAVRKTDRGEQFLGTLAAPRPGDAEQPRVNSDIFGAGELGIAGHILRNHADVGSARRWGRE